MHPRRTGRSKWNALAAGALCGAAALAGVGCGGSRPAAAPQTATTEAPSSASAGAPSAAAPATTPTTATTAPASPATTTAPAQPPGATTSSASPPTPSPAPAASTTATSTSPAPSAPAARTTPARPAESINVQALFEEALRAAPATLQPKGAAGDDALSRGVREAAKKSAAGMEADGPLATGTLSDRQKLQTDVTLQPGKCYAIVGYSKKVRDLDLYLLLAPGILSARDASDDATAVIGGPPQPMCPVASSPITYKLLIGAGEGAGDVAVQLYSKAR